MLLDGDIDLLAGLAFREERTALLSYPDAIMGSEAYYLVKQDSQRDITADPATLRGKVIGVLDSAMVGVLETWLDDHRIDATVVAYPDHPQLFGAFDSGELDVFVAEGVGSHVRPHAEVMYAFGSSDYYLCVNIRRPDLLDELNAAQIMLAAEEPNYLNSLSAKYYSLSVTARAFSSAEREWMDTHDALRVGYLENYLPYSDTGEDGQVTGLVKDLVPEILSTLGISDISVTWAGYRSYDDMVADMASGEIDTDFTGRRLLLAEDNVINKEIAVMILQQMSFEVDTAENGQIALDMVASAEPGTYDAVLMDIQMPVMDGYTAARAIRALDDPARSGIPILAMTANAFHEDVQAAFDAGMQAHIAKPIDIGKLTDALKAVIK